MALIGAGRGARFRFAPTIFQNPAFHLRAVWSRTQASAKRFNVDVAGRSLEVFHSEEGLQRLLERSDIEGFVVSLPASVQPVFIERILKHRGHVLSEAPTSLGQTQAHEMLRHLEESLESRCVWFVSNPLRYEPVFRPSCLRLESIGPIFAAEIYAVLVVDPSRALDGPARSEESLFIESGAQYIAVLQQLLGNITEVNCVLVSNAPGQGCAPLPAVGEPLPVPKATLFWEDALSGALRFESGTMCAVNWQTSGNDEDRRFCLTLRGSRGLITVEQEAGSQAAASGIVRYSITRSLPSSGVPSSGRQPSSVAAVSAGSERQLEAWGRAIRSSSEKVGLDLRDEDIASARSSPQHTIADICVMSAMLRSRGTRVQISRFQVQGKSAN